MLYFLKTISRCFTVQYHLMGSQMQLVNFHCHAQHDATDCKPPVEKQTKPDVRERRALLKALTHFIALSANLPKNLCKAASSCLTKSDKIYVLGQGIFTVG